jgi:hypothetical protein
MKKLFPCLFSIFVLLACYSTISAQNTRLHTRETIGWFNIFPTFKLDDQWSVHSEYQFRRAGLVSEFQQSLLRVGINYQASPRALLRAGYAWAETFAYGDIPINALGRDFTEHRIFEMLQLSHREGIADFSHRFMLEQRWVGRYSSPAVNKEDEFPLLHRMRYMMRFQLPLKGKTMGDKTPYLAAYDEIFIGFGKNVGENIFDQNRYGLLLGYRFNKTMRIEAGYLNQTIQFGREIDGRNVFQHNNGLVVNGYLNLDF